MCACLPSLQNLAHGVALALHDAGLEDVQALLDDVELDQCEVSVVLILFTVRMQVFSFDEWKIKSTGTADLTPSPHASKDYKPATHNVQRTYRELVEVRLVQAVYIADLPQPVLQQTQVLALRRRSDSPAVIVTC